MVNNTFGIIIILLVLLVIFWLWQSNYVIIKQHDDMKKEMDYMIVCLVKMADHSGNEELKTMAYELENSIKDVDGNEKQHIGKVLELFDYHVEKSKIEGADYQEDLEAMGDCLVEIKDELDNEKSKEYWHRYNMIGSHRWPYYRMRRRWPYRYYHPYYYYRPRYNFMTYN